MVETVLLPKLNEQKLGLLVCRAERDWAGPGMTRHDKTGHDKT